MDSLASKPAMLFFNYYSNMDKVQKSKVFFVKLLHLFVLVAVSARHLPTSSFTYR
jgi:hypothetical protein